METQITSHLLAALNLPPLRGEGPYLDSDRPLPLEPSASQDSYPSRRALPGPAPQKEQRQQQQQHESSRQNGPSTDEITPPVGMAYPPIITPPQAADPPLPHTPISQSQIPPVTPNNSSNRRAQPKKSLASTNRRARRKWTEQETNDLILGCHEHGVGNWKKVLDDPRFNFNGRSSVDLKDRYVITSQNHYTAKC